MPMRAKLKRGEKAFASFVVGSARLFGAGLLRASTWCLQALNQRFTVLLVSSCSDDPRRICLKWWTPVSVGLAFLVATPIVIFLGCRTPALREMNLAIEKEYRQVNDPLEMMRDETAAAIAATKEIERVDERLRAQLFADGGGAEIDRFFGSTGAEARANELPEPARLAKAVQTLESAENSIATAGRVLVNHNEVLRSLPTLWPIKGGIGHVSQAFGLNPNPFSGEPYFHKGLDISNYRPGDPVVASADGTVANAFFDFGYGNNVILQHKYGYYTRYGHMQSFRVRPGQQVRQGEVIGYVGNTGLSTGPHVHLEVRLGSELIDPFSLLDTKKGPRPMPLFAPTGRDGAGQV